MVAKVLIAMVLAANTVPSDGLPPPKPHMHYEIVLSPHPWTPTSCLARACRLSKAIIARARNQSDIILRVDAAALRLVACGPANRTRTPGNPNYKND